jgi:hypothetical protein
MAVIRKGRRAQRVLSIGQERPRHESSIPGRSRARRPLGQACWRGGLAYIVADITQVRQLASSSGFFGEGP